MDLYIQNDYQYPTQTVMDPNESKFIYKTNYGWVVRRGCTFGKFKTYEEALKKRNELINTGIIKITKKNKKASKKFKINEETLKNFKTNEKTKTLQNFKTIKPKILIPKPENDDIENLNIETQVQLCNYINNLENIRSEIIQSENQIKVNIQKIISSISKQKNLVYQLNELDKREQMLLNLLNIIN